jgi:K+-sensing histidine kinase KdpD
LDFAAGLTLGCLLGVATTLGILVFVAAIPNEDRGTGKGVSYSGLAVSVLLILAVTWAVRAMNLRDGALALFLLLIALASSRLRGLRTGLAASAFAAFVLCLALPPVWSLKVEQSRDQLLLAVFIVSAAVGCHLASGISESARRRSSGAARIPSTALSENVTGE